MNKPFDETPTISLIEGDGIGPEVTRATCKVLEACGAKITWEPVNAGLSAIKTYGSPIPQATLDSIARNRLVLKGPLATPVGTGISSVNAALRKHFDMYANLRPAKSVDGVPCKYENVDIVVIRENIEDLYSGLESYANAEKTVTEAVSVISQSNSERIVRFAFEYARKHDRQLVTLVHKANILKISNGLFLKTGREVAKDYPDIEFDDMIVDASVMKMVLEPERFDVVVTMNVFGDIISDLTAGLIGGLGVAPGVNMGHDGIAMFEGVHGTAPDIAGKGIANPSSMMLSSALMLEHIGQHRAATRLRAAIHQVLANPETRTCDLGGPASTDDFTEAICKALRKERPTLELKALTAA